MQTTSEHRPPQQDEKARLPWHRPQVRQLVVNIATLLRGGSVEDGDGLGPFAVDDGV